jgi:hypothetical protein
MPRADWAIDRPRREPSVARLDQVDNRPRNPALARAATGLRRWAPALGSGAGLGRWVRPYRIAMIVESGPAASPPRR